MFQTPDGRWHSLVRAWAGGRPIPFHEVSVSLLRDGAPAVETLSVQNLGNGWIRASYLPEGEGRDEIVFSAPSRGFEARDIQGVWSVHRLDHDFREPGFLRLNEPEPQRYRIRVFRMDDWNAGRQSPADCLADVAADAQGKWMEPVFVAAGRYVVAAFGPGRVVVIAANLDVGPHQGDPDYSWYSEDPEGILVEDPYGVVQSLLLEEEDEVVSP